MPEKSKKKSKTIAKKVPASVKAKKVIVQETLSQQSETKRKDTKVSSKQTEEAVTEVSGFRQPPLEQKFGLNDSVNLDIDVELAATKFVQKQVKAPEQLTVSLSHSLIRKIREQAADEGISTEEFVTELLSEGVVLRAWEIVERKNQMKGGNSSVGHTSGNHNRHNMSHGNQNGNSARSHNQRGNNKSQRAMNHMRYQAIMEDKASFLEYVRNQERTRR